jgi:hypothetical protein
MVSEAADPGEGNAKGDVAVVFGPEFPSLWGPGIWSQTEFLSYFAAESQVRFSGDEILPSVGPAFEPIREPPRQVGHTLGTRDPVGLWGEPEFLVISPEIPRL